MKLSDLQPGERAIVVKVLGHGAFRKRIMEMGFVSGREVSMEFDAPLKDPTVYKIMDYEVSLRKSEADMIKVITEQSAKERVKKRSGGEIKHGSIEQVIDNSKRIINVALIGNPNSGKTSLFNIASGGHEHVGNYGGVTVDAKRGQFKYKGYKFIMYDLPGTYALTAYSPEELFVRRHLTTKSPDVVVNVVSASNLERNLYLTTELVDMDCMMVMALNMYDELESSGSELDHDSLGDMLGMPIIPTVSKGGKGIEPLLDGIIEVYEGRDPKIRHTHITHSIEVESAIEAMDSVLSASGSIVEHFSTRYMAIKMLERDREIEKLLHKHDDYPKWAKQRDELVEQVEKTLGEDLESAITADKYGFIAGALRQTYKPGVKEQFKATQLIDSIVTSKTFGFPIFILIMWLMFWTTFKLGDYPMGWIESGVDLLSGWLSAILSEGMLKDLLVDGIVAGVGEVIVFLPNILILYLFISFMEDTGYMARAAFIMDKLMHRMGLHGKSFIPLVMGFGCNVPAIMATRSIESRSSRLITILVNPFMSCSARLPIYILLIGIFFPKHGALVMLSIYLFGIVVAIVTARLLRKFMFKKDDTPFVMELPPYRMPTFLSTLSHMWDKALLYLKKMGGIILIASIIVWFLGYFPRQDSGERERASAQTEQVEPSEHAIAAIEVDASRQTAALVAIDSGADSGQYQELSQKEGSYIGRIGRFISPIMQPLGFNWQISVALVSGVAAKEVVVSTLAVLYADESPDDPETDGTLATKLRQIDPKSGRAALTTAGAVSLLIFTLLYFPCIAAMTAISREAGSWKWGAFSFLYNTTLAWVLAFIAYQIGTLF